MRKKCRRKVYEPSTKVAPAVAGYLWHVNKFIDEIHILIGGDSDKLVEGAGRIYFVILGACMAQEIGADDPDVRILRGAVEAMHEQADNPVVDEVRRLSIVSGLWACNRLMGRLKRQNIVNSAGDLNRKLKAGDVRYSDFLLTGKRTP